MKTQHIFNYPLFALGFRAFFLLAGLSALVLLVLWSAIVKGNLTADNYFPHTYWHAHEMLLGYSSAVIAGFLLTAIKNWTGKQTLTGDPLAGLCLLWLYGRIVPFYAGLLPDALIAAIDFAFLPLLAYQCAKPIIAAKNFNNMIFIGILLILAIGNSLIHAEILGLLKSSANLGIELVLATLILLILVIAGRVFPFFTERALSGTLIIRNPLLDNLAIGSAAVMFACQLFAGSGHLLAWAAIIAAILNIARVSVWYVRRIWYVPLLWILYIGYAWIIFGFVLTALSAYGWVLPSLAMHALTVGGIAVLTLGMMARVSLGHTGRALKASNAIAIAFLLLNLAVLFRVILPIAVQGWYNVLLYISTLCWLAAFSLFIFVYSPILSSARIDGKEG